MEVIILTCGFGLKNPELEILDDYSKRINKRVKFSVLEVKPGKDGILRLTAFTQDDSSGKDFVVVLDERGQKFDNLSFAKKLDGVMSSGGYKRIIFVVGGAYGVPEEIKLRADLTWSFSEQVFPHKLFTVMLAEQIYRSLEIIAGSPYHHE